MNGKMEIDNCSDSCKLEIFSLQSTYSKVYNTIQITSCNGPYFARRIRGEYESDVDSVELFRLTLRFFDDVSTASYIFFDSDFKFFNDASEFSVTSLYVVFFSSKFISVFLQVRFL